MMFGFFSGLIVVAGRFRFRVRVFRVGLVGLITN